MPPRVLDCVSSGPAVRSGSQKNGFPLKEIVLPKFRSSPAAVYRLAEINAYLGNKDEAFQWLERAYEYRTLWMPWVKADPSIDALRSDPRFDALLRRMGLTP